MSENLKPFDSRPQRGWWAPGSYMCQCYKCKVNYTGAKHSHMCADCAYAIPEEKVEVEKPTGETPRTNAVAYDVGGHQHEDGAIVESRFSRKLECELNAANERIKALESSGTSTSQFGEIEPLPSDYFRTQLEKANARIKKLEGVILELTAAGNCVENDKLTLRNWLKEKGDVYSTIGNVSTDLWINAKEWDRKEKGLA